MHAALQSLARITNPTLQNIMPLRTTLYQQVLNAQSSELLCTMLLQVLGAIEGVDVVSEPRNPDSTELPSILATGTEVTWSRSARRKKTSHLLQRTSQRPIIMQCRITCANGSYPNGEKQQILGPHLVYQWVCGSDRGVFESFVSHVNRKVIAMS